MNLAALLGRNVAIQKGGKCRLENVSRRRPREEKKGPDRSRERDIERRAKSIDSLRPKGPAKGLGGGKDPRY